MLNLRCQMGFMQDLYPEHAGHVSWSCMLLCSCLYGLQIAAIILDSIHETYVQDGVSSWGHEYIRSLSGEIGEEYHARREKSEGVDDLLGLVAQIVPFHMTHNAGKPLLRMEM